MALTDLSAFRGLTVSVADQLRTTIVDGELAPGQRLVQDELARTLGVSREPVRQALRMLEAEGLVVHRPRRGVVVAPVAEQVVRDVYDVRAALDGLAARRSVGRLTAPRIDEARRIVRAARRHLERGDVAGLLADDRAFHALILDASGNQVARDVLAAQWNRVGAVMRAVLESGYAHQAWQEHEAIIGAIAAGDAERAESLAREHAWGAAAMLGARLAGIAQDAGKESA